MASAVNDGAVETDGRLGILGDAHYPTFRPPRGIDLLEAAVADVYRIGSAG